MPRDPRHSAWDRLVDVLRATRRIAEKTSPGSYEQFADDEDAFELVCYQILIIGEAVAFLPDDLKAMHPDLDWRGMKGMRNVMAHVYFGVDRQIVWQTATVEVPRLRAAIEEYLRKAAPGDFGEDQT